MILIIGDENDPHSRFIKNRVEAAGGVACVLDFATLADSTRVSFNVGPTGVKSCLDAGEIVDFADVQTIWLRRPTMVHPPAAVSSSAARTFIRHEWSAAVNGMVMAQDHLRWVNDPFAQNAASKPLQLHCARKVGLTIPDTLITNDPHMVRDFLKEREGNVIHKALTHAEGHLLDTRAWDDDRDGVHLDVSLPVAPVIFQSLIRGGDVRSVIIGDVVLSVFIDTETSRSEIDARLDMDAAYSVHELPDETVRMLCEFMGALGLVFGVVDLKVDREGRYVFLEVNPQGQFLFMEILTQLPISETLTRFLLSEPDPDPARVTGCHG